MPKTGPGSIGCLTRPSGTERREGAAGGKSRVIREGAQVSTRGTLKFLGRLQVLAKGTCDSAPCGFGSEFWARSGGTQFVVRNSLVLHHLRRRFACETRGAVVSAGAKLVEFTRMFGCFFTRLVQNAGSLGIGSWSFGILGPRTSLLPSRLTKYSTPVLATWEAWSREQFDFAHHRQGASSRDWILP